MFHLRSNNKYLLSPPSVKTRLGDIAFEAAAPKLWNDLPHDIRITGDFTSFKQKTEKSTFLNEFISIGSCYFYILFYILLTFYS